MDGIQFSADLNYYLHLPPDSLGVLSSAVCPFADLLASLLGSFAASSAELNVMVL